MKITDDYNAKLKIWTAAPRAYSVPVITNLPKFGCKRFRSYQEMNDWKEELLDELARAGGAEWSRSSSVA